MANTVYDTSVIVYSNGDLAGRRRGNALDRRLSKIEEFIQGKRVAWYNGKLLHEYQGKLKNVRNDVIDLFLTQLELKGKLASKGALSRQEYGRAQKMGWPAHDQHLLACAIQAAPSTMFVTEKTLVTCAKDVHREFDVQVQQL